MNMKYSGDATSGYGISEQEVLSIDYKRLNAML